MRVLTKTLVWSQTKWTPALSPWIDRWAYVCPVLWCWAGWLTARSLTALTRFQNISEYFRIFQNISEYVHNVPYLLCRRGAIGGRTFVPSCDVGLGGRLRGRSLRLQDVGIVYSVIK